jgi:Protein of unknown function (DUF998)
MTQSTLTRPTAAVCDPATRVTRSLLGYGVIAGPLYVTVSLAQAFTRDGFDPRRHEWSLLANGHLGWVQTVNFIVTGLMVVAGSVGLRRSGAGRAAAWLIAGYGLGLVGAGIFRADPALGFPPGTPDGPGTISWHGMLHLVTAMIGFSCLIAACVVLARRQAGQGRRAWAAWSWGTGAVFLAAFVGVASGAGSVAVTLAFIAAVVLAWAWISAVSVHAYRTTTD